MAHCSSSLILKQRLNLFSRLDRIRDEIAELGDVAVSMVTDVVKRQEVNIGRDKKKEIGVKHSV